MQLLCMPSSASGCCARHRGWLLLSPAWLVFVVEEAERAKFIIYYQPLPLLCRQLSERPAEPRRLGARAPHHSLEYTHSALITLPGPPPLGLRHVNRRRSRLAGLGDLLPPPVLKRNSCPASRSPGWRLRSGHVEGVPPFLVHKVPERFLGGLPYPVGPLPGPLPPIHGWHPAQYAGQGLVVDQTPEHACLPGSHHGGPKEGVEFMDGPTIEWLVHSELDNRVQGLGDVLVRPVVAGCPRPPSSRRYHSPFGGHGWPGSSP